MQRSFKGVHHIAMATGNLDKTIRYWRDLLRMRMVGAFGKKGYKQYFFEISEGSCISFFEWEGVEPIHEKDHGRAVRGQFAFDHISFEVSSEDELWEIKDRLEHNGEWISEVIDHGIILSVYTFDPNGIAIEFTYQKKGLSLQENPLDYDKDPTPIAKEGIEPQLDIFPNPAEPTPVKQRKTHRGLMKDYMI
ncbi:MAG: VOC family protein [Thermodesulfovibrionales bacterium]|nr:VOC family protein [Thermodesulfovibrionales bacterium]